MKRPFVSCFLIFVVLFISCAVQATRGLFCL